MGHYDTAHATDREARLERQRQRDKVRRADLKRNIESGELDDTLLDREDHQRFTRLLLDTCTELLKRVQDLELQVRSLERDRERARGRSVNSQPPRRRGLGYGG